MLKIQIPIFGHRGVTKECALQSYQTVVLRGGKMGSQEDHSNIAYKTTQHYIMDD
jgi:hypothetical protein